MSLPDFINIGAMKSGTSALRYYLRQHPQIYMPDFEPHYFDREYDKPIQQYEEIFEEASEGELIGEKTPAYIYRPSVPKRIHNHIPNVKLIALLRDPVERAYSHYCQRLRAGEEELDFKEAIEKERERLEEGDIQEREEYSYVDRGKYHEQIERYLKYFDRDQVLILPSEDLRNNREKTLREILEFIGADKDFEFKSLKDKGTGGLPPFGLKFITKLATHPVIGQIPILGRGLKFINTLGDKPPMNEEAREELIETFKPHNEKLKQYVDFDPSEKWENFQ